MLFPTLRVACSRFDRLSDRRGKGQGFFFVSLRSPMNRDEKSLRFLPELLLSAAKGFETRALKGYERKVFVTQHYPR